MAPFRLVGQMLHPRSLRPVRRDDLAGLDLLGVAGFTSLVAERVNRWYLSLRPLSAGALRSQGCTTAVGTELTLLVPAAFVAKTCRRSVEPASARTIR